MTRCSWHETIGLCNCHASLRCQLFMTVDKDRLIDPVKTFGVAATPFLMTMSSVSAHPKIPLSLATSSRLVRMQRWPISRSRLSKG